MTKLLLFFETSAKSSIFVTEFNTFFLFSLIMTNERNHIQQLDFSDVKGIDAGLKYIDDEIAFADNIRSVSALQDVFSVNFFALVFCLNGELSLRLNSTPFTIKRFDGLFVDAKSVVSDIAHDDRFECKIIGICNGVGLSFINRSLFNAFLSMKEHPVVHFNAQEMHLFGKYYELALFKMEHRELARGKESMMNLLRAYLLDLIAGLDHVLDHKKDHRMMRQGDKIFRKFVLMLAHNDDRLRSVSEFAERLCVSPKYLSSLCLQHASMTAGALITQSTIAAIKQQLLYSELSIKEIALQMGFDNLSFFGKYVKKHLGMSPNKFRQANNYGH